MIYKTLPQRRGWEHDTLLDRTVVYTRKYDTAVVMLTFRLRASVDDVSKLEWQGEGVYYVSDRKCGMVCLGGEDPFEWADGEFRKAVGK